jgi:hypothetical protein
MIAKTIEAVNAVFPETRSNVEDTTGAMNSIPMNP